MLLYAQVQLIKDYMSKKKDIIILDKMDEKVSTNFVRGYKTFWPFLKPYFFWAVLGVILTIPVGALDAVVASFLKPFMDNVMVAQDAEFSTLVPVFIIGFTVIQGICIYASNIVNAYVGSKVSMDLKNALFKRLLRFESRFFDKNTSGSVIMRFAGDADTATSGLIANLKLFLQKFFSSLALVVVLLYNSWELSFIAVGVLLLIVYPMKIVRKRIKQITLRTLSSGAKLNTYYYETYSGIKTIKSFNLQDQMATSYKDNYKSLFVLGMKIVRDTNWLAPFMHLVTAFGVAGVLYFGLHLIETKDITAGTFVAFLAALIMLYTPIKSIGNNYIAVQNSLLALDRISQLLHAESFESASEDGKDELTEIKKDITFDNVTFSYDGEKTILDSISLKVPVGTKVALVGNSGGGKSTVCSLIPRLYDIDKGSIKVDGKDIREYSLSSLRDKISMVFQDNFLFAGTIRDNLLYGKKDATQEQIEFAIKSAYLDDFIDKLPDGLDTVIGERGLLLSGGQRQRLAIARAVVRKPEIYVFDDSFSALDFKTDKALRQALSAETGEATVVIVAQRISTIIDADRIIVVEKGEVVGMGTHKELVETCDVYKEIVDSNTG